MFGWDKDKTIDAVHELYVKRMHTDNILDILPDYRVTWTEVWELMRKHGFDGDVVAGRLAWHEATKKIKWPGV
jgi:hypothetical protein